MKKVLLWFFLFFFFVKSCFLGLPVTTKLDILQHRRLSDIICDNTDIEVLPINIFDLQSETLPCKNRTTPPSLGETFLITKIPD